MRKPGVGLPGRGRKTLTFAPGAASQTIRCSSNENSSVEFQSARSKVSESSFGVSVIGLAFMLLA
jgi:hypothetical protein